MAEFGWTKDVIAKAMSAEDNQKGSMSVSDAGIPVVEGSFVIPPVIQRSGVTYHLRREGRAEPYKNVIRVNKENGDNYSYVPDKGEAGVTDEEAKEQTEAYDYSMQEGSSTFQKLTKELQNTSMLSQNQDEEVLDVEFTASDKPVNDLLEEISGQLSHRSSGNIIARRFHALLDYMDTGEGTSARKLKQLLSKGIRHEEDLKFAEKLTGDISNSNVLSDTTKPLVSNHVQALLNYKLITLDNSSAQHELDVLQNTINVVTRLLMQDFIIYNPGVRVEKNTVSYSKNIITSLILNKAIAELTYYDESNVKKGFSCYSYYKDISFTELPGFSTHAGWALDAFFSNAEDIEILIDNRAIDLDKHTCKMQFKESFRVLKIVDHSNDTYIKIDYSDITYDGLNAQYIDDEYRANMRTYKNKDLLNVALLTTTSKNYLTLFNINNDVGSMHTRENFLTVGKGKNKKKFNLTYSRDIVHDHKGQLGKFFIARVHDESEKVDLPNLKDAYNISINRIKEHSDDINNYVKELRSQESTPDREQALGELIPILTALRRKENPSPSDINFSYYEYLGLLSGLIDTPKKYDTAYEFFSKYGYIPTTPSKFLADLQRNALDIHQLRNQFGQLDDAKIDVDTAKDNETKYIEDVLVKNLSRKFEMIFDDYSTSASITSPMQILLQKINNGVSNLHEDRVVLDLIKPIREDGAIWKVFYEKLTGRQFEGDVFIDKLVHHIFHKIDVNNYLHRLFDIYLPILVIGQYLKEFVFDSNATLSLVDVNSYNEVGLDFSKEQDPLGTFFDILIGSKRKQVIKSEYTIGNETRIFLFNSQSSSGIATGMVDYGVDVVSLNPTVTDSGQMSYNIFFETDTLRFLPPTSRNSYTITNTHEAALFAQKSTNNILRLIKSSIPGYTINTITVNRGINLSIGSSLGVNAVHSYILRDASATALKETVLGKAEAKRRVPLEDTSRYPGSQSVPIINSVVYLEGSPAHEKFTESDVPFLYVEIVVTKSFAEEYARRYARELKNTKDEESINKSIVDAMYHPIIGRKAYAEFVKELHEG